MLRGPTREFLRDVGVEAALGEGMVGDSRPFDKERLGGEVPSSLIEGVRDAAGDIQFGLVSCGEVLSLGLFPFSISFSFSGSSSKLT